MNNYLLIISIIFLILVFVFAINNIFRKEYNDGAKYARSLFIKALPYICFISSSFFAYLSAGNSLFVSIWNSFSCFIHVLRDYNGSNFIEFLNSLAIFITITSLLSNLRESIKLIVYLIADKYIPNKEIYIIHGINNTSNTIKDNFENPEKADSEDKKGNKDINVIRVNEKNEKLYNMFSKHIVVYDSYEQNIKTATYINEQNKNATIYALANKLDTRLFMNNDRIVIFDKNELILNSFWNKYNCKIIHDVLKTKSFKNCTISIVGSNELTYKMFLLIARNCLFDLKQSININVITAFNYISYFKTSKNTIDDLMTNDSITINELNDDSVKKLHNSDILILCDQDIVSKISLKLKKVNDVFLYSSSFNNDNYANLYDKNDSKSDEYNYVHLFGDDKSIFNYKNITNNRKTLLAQMINYGYYLLYNNEKEFKKFKKYDINDENVYKDIKKQWDDLNTYNLNSSYAATEYIEIRKLIKNTQNNLNLKLLEHIRWCRFMYLEGYKYGKKTNHTIKEHKCLIPFTGSQKFAAELEKDEWIYKLIDANEKN